MPVLRWCGGGLGRWTKDGKKDCKEQSRQVMDFSFLRPVTWDLWPEFEMWDRRGPRMKEYK